jgi:hypothetical protein
VLYVALAAMKGRFEICRRTEEWVIGYGTHCSMKKESKSQYAGSTVTDEFAVAVME